MQIAGFSALTGLQTPRDLQCTLHAARKPIRFRPYDSIAWHLRFRVMPGSNVNRTAKWIGNFLFRKHVNMKKQTGFTLIELVMVIVILGILSAVALPKFVNLGSDARTAAMKAVEGSMRSTNSIIYAKAAIANQMVVNGTVTINGVAVTTRYGFALNVNELIKVMDLGPDFNTATANQIRHAGAVTTANCRVTYAPATATATPTYTTLTTGC